MGEFLQNIGDFIAFTDPNVRFVVVGMFFIGIASAVVGTFTVLKKQSLLGDAVSHSVLPGICLSFMLFESRNPALLLGGAFIAGWVSTVAIDYIVSNSKLKQDAAIGLVLSVFFGVGMLLLTSIQHSGIANQSGLDKFLFGKAASILPEDIYLFAFVALFLLGVIGLFYHQFRLIIFDRNYAETIGLNVGFYEFILSSITVLAIVIGIQAVGVVLMSALLITPTIAARFWSNRLWVVLIVAAIIGIVSTYFGGLISYIAPGMPTGPWIVVVLSVLAFTSMLFAPQKGFVFKQIRLRNNRLKSRNENILKTLYHLCEACDDFDCGFTVKQIIERRMSLENDLTQGLNVLLSQKQVWQKNDLWGLTQSGKEEGMRIVRIHRLWELYLTKFLNLKDDHVHETADAIEHILTPELEAELEAILEHPEADPHSSPIPYKN